MDDGGAGVADEDIQREILPIPDREYRA